MFAMLDNRELASLIWLGIALLLILFTKKVRSGLASVLLAFFHPVICIPLLFVLGYIGLEVWFGSLLHLWNSQLLTGTIIWTVGTAAVFFFNIEKAAKDPRFFWRTAAATVGVAVFVAFFMNLFLMNLFAELLLQPVMLALGLLAAVAGMNQEHRQVKRLVDGLLAFIGFGLLAFTLWQLQARWPDLDKHQFLLEFLLPIWLTIGLLPFIYLLSLYTGYDSAFRGVNWAAKEPRARWRARAALVTSFHVRHHDLHAFSWNWARRLTEAPGYIAARQLISEFKKEREQERRAAAEEKKLLRRYAGVDGTDSAGRRLDRQEFKETMDALTWLHTCHMGWYQNHGGRYRADLLNMLESDFVRRGLPREHGVIMRVAKDGQSWYAWRRTITGWCFAIGAAGPPPDRWEFDGPQQPGGFPGREPSWGSAPSSSDANPNWM